MSPTTGAQGTPLPPGARSGRQDGALLHRTGKDIPELSLEEFRQFSPQIEADIFAAVTLEASVNARQATGGTARAAVEREIARARQALTAP
jgi:argininosuccinate lyase